MMRLCTILFFSVVIQSCISSESKPDEIAETNLDKPLDSLIQLSYDAVYDWHSVIGVSKFWTCNEQDRIHFDNIINNSKPSELIYMLKDSCSTEFKVCLMQEISVKYPDHKSELLNKYKDDTTSVRHVSSCVGFVFYRTLAEECVLIESNYQLELDSEPEPIFD